MIEREQPLAAAPPLFIGRLRKLLAMGLRHCLRANEPIHFCPSSPAAAWDQERAMSKNRFLTGPVGVRLP
jgi:hypothetical protein